MSSNEESEKSNYILFKWGPHHRPIRAITTPPSELGSIPGSARSSNHSCTPSYWNREGHDINSFVAITTATNIVKLAINKGVARR
jgi:hypothetical protein